MFAGINQLTIKERDRGNFLRGLGLSLINLQKQKSNSGTLTRFDI